MIEKAWVGHTGIRMKIGKFTVREFSISGPLLITSDVYPDDRGFFTERFRMEEFAQIGLPPFIQDNFSRSQPRILRGLHCQWDPPQGKLVTVIRGKIFDVAVDLRAQSPTFGKHVAVTLDGDRPQWFWLPPGFAHGFAVLGEEPADVIYKVNAPYNPQGETAVMWNDAELAIDWPVRDPLMSPKDKIAQSFNDYKNNPKF